MEVIGSKRIWRGGRQGKESRMVRFRMQDTTVGTNQRPTTRKGIKDTDILSVARQSITSEPHGGRGASDIGLGSRV